MKQTAPQRVAILVVLASIGARSAHAAPATAPTTAPTTAAAATGEVTTVGRQKTGRMADHFLRHHQQYLERGRRGDVGVVFLGDSITQKWRDAHELWASRYEGPLRAVNFGIMGDAIQHVLWRVEQGELDGVNARLVVLLIGTNNSRRPDAGPIFDGIAHLVGVVRQRAPTTKVLVMAIFPRERPGDDPVQMRNIAAVNARLPALDDGNMTRVLNVNDRFYDAAGAFRHELFADGLHLNPAGYRVWADAMEPRLKEMLKP